MPIKVGPLSSAVISLSSVTAVAGNILNNGDFSKGFSCYSAYEWSNNHQFLLSTNSRSGGHAAEIYCANNCSKAAIFPATGIPVTPGRSYAISLYTKCQPGSSGALYLPKTTTGNFLRGISCNGSWNQTKVTFTPAAEDTTFSFSIYNEGAGAQSGQGFERGIDLSDGARFKNSRLEPEGSSSLLGFRYYSLGSRICRIDQQSDQIRRRL